MKRGEKKSTKNDKKRSRQVLGNQISVPQGHWGGIWGGNMDVNISQEIWNFFNQMSIDNTTIIEENTNNLSEKFIVKRYDILGREFARKGLSIILYNDGSVEKKYIIN